MLPEGERGTKVVTEAERGCRSLQEGNRELHIGPCAVRPAVQHYIFHLEPGHHMLNGMQAVPQPLLMGVPTAASWLCTPPIGCKHLQLPPTCVNIDRLIDSSVV